MTHFELILKYLAIISRRLGPTNGNAMDVVAMAPIAEGAEIKTRYMTPQWGTVRRQQLTQNYWHFVCRERNRGATCLLTSCDENVKLITLVARLSINHGLGLKSYTEIGKKVFLFS